MAITVFFCAILALYMLRATVIRGGGRNDAIDKELSRPASTGGQAMDSGMVLSAAFSEETGMAVVKFFGNYSAHP